MNWVRSIVSVLVGIGTLLVLVGLGFAAYKSIAEVQQTLWLVVGVICLLLALLAYAYALRSIDEQGRRGPLGLPDGSIGAVLALMLLLFFAISSTYLYLQIDFSTTQGAVSNGVTSEVLAGLPEDRIIEINVEQQGAPDGTGRTYTVKLAPNNKESVDFARNVQTTVGTLLVAIIGFYFGQRATEAGVQARPTDRIPPRKKDAAGDLGDA